MKTAKSNSDLFEQVFGGVCIPTGAATNFEELKEFRVSTIIIVAVIIATYKLYYKTKRQR